MKDFKKNIYKSFIEADTIVLDPFDYMIVTYNYRFDDFQRDLDSATKLANTGSIEDTKIIGCGQNAVYITPSMSTPISDAYLYQNGDDAGNGRGESILINFKNIELANISLNNDIQVELYGGWCTPNYIDIASVSVTTYTGGVISLAGGSLNTITSTGTINNQFLHTDFPVSPGCCGTAVTSKTHIGTIYYNLQTKNSRVVFY